MNHLFLSALFGSHAILANQFPPGFYIPIAAMLFSLVVVIVASINKAHKRQLEHETIRIALEKGQPIPAGTFANHQPEHRGCGQGRDRRVGIILIAIALGLFGFLQAVTSDRAYMVALIPGFIGIAFLINSRLDAKQPPSQNRS